MTIDDGQAAHRRLLETLAHGDAGRIKAFAEELLPELGTVEVLRSRTGLVMVPMRDTVRGVDFHLGEVLVAEAQVKLAGVQGYGMVVGRDLEHAMAMALIDAAAFAGMAQERIGAFVEAEAAILAETDRRTLRAVEATRVEMETFG
ncbi:phosphonate C-P lyase system protein PhnG [Labrys wisconsinensis]|uniref:Alpha-D-ribose 1-methylphosphonate 5-triphosphate synthase subunit PhnG n=1 Tax=Labrys wisconsinensis TaxID=425677 RepID=A0ABU0JFK4_9HYPH|nr:phosphonate C-P lyase system protein PhnG [Labrys wisconsinensis]MDQ0473066.1 alpha-D-ribose 1-methylphosphonate 5-triphosphate synthase subunit PhnG [Labrys wisconsinensis]